MAINRGYLLLVLVLSAISYAHTDRDEPQSSSGFPSDEPTISEGAPEDVGPKAHPDSTSSTRPVPTSTKPVLETNVHKGPMIPTTHVVGSEPTTDVSNGGNLSNTTIPTTGEVTEETTTEATEETTTDDITPTTPPGESEESVASISIFFIMLLLGISVLMVHSCIKFNFHYFPESIGFVVVGAVVGAVMFILNHFGYDYQYQETLSPQSFFLVLLPPIIFESGYSLHKGNFFQNLGSIVVFAVLGTAISAVIVGGALYALGIMGVVYELDLIQSFTFGSLISAVDPVATLAIFHALDVDPTLNMLVFGESVLNDAVSIVLTKTILNQLDTSETSAISVLGNSAWQFCVMFFGSAFLGVFSALTSALVLKHINLRHHQSLEFALWLLFAFGPYFLAEGVHLSGIMTILFNGIVMSQYTHFNLSPVTQVTVQQALRTVAFMAETGVFLYLGLALFSINKSFDLALIMWTLILTLVGRAANIFPLTALLNCCRSFKISTRMQCIMWYSGLRGAVAFALAENLREYFPPEVTSYIVTTTLMIVLFTVLVLGGSTLPLLKFLEADKGATLTLIKTEEQDGAITAQALDRRINYSYLRNLTNFSERFVYFDYRFIKPFLTRKFTRQEVQEARHEMQQKTVEWFQGLRDTKDCVSDEESTASTTVTSPLTSP